MMLRPPLERKERRECEREKKKRGRKEKKRRRKGGEKRERRGICMENVNTGSFLKRRSKLLFWEGNNRLAQQPSSLSIALP